jgi:hypothetical protein
MVGFIVLIPIALFAVDVVALMSTAQTNEQWAETAARAGRLLQLREHGPNCRKKLTEALCPFQHNPLSRVRKNHLRSNQWSGNRGHRDAN